MPYQEETIKTIVDRLNTQYFLPAIQREYIWKPEQVVLLFDSIMRGYPISSFLFWELTQENRDRWDLYNFAMEANSDGTRHTKRHAVDGIHNLTLVLDGQQRLTSILIGLKGVYRVRKSGRWAAKPENWSTNVLYIDLFEDPKPVDEDHEFTGKPYYGLSWKKDKPEPDERHHWFRVGRILECQDDDAFYRLREEEEAKFPPGLSKAKENQFERNLARLYHAIWKDAAISYYVERDQDYDRVLDIFVRANEAGTELTKPQILMAMFTSKWQKYKAKNEIDELLWNLNTQMQRQNRFALEFIMRSCLVLSELPVPYRVNSFTNSAIAEIENQWPAIKQTLERTVRLVNSFGIDQNNLTSSIALIPLAYFLHRYPSVTFLNNSRFEVKNAKMMRRWLVMALLNGVFGRASQQVLTNTRSTIAAVPSGGDFPYLALNDELSRLNYTVRLDAVGKQRFLSTTYPNTFLPLSILYSDFLWGVIPHQQDHIFPKALFSLENNAFASLSEAHQRRFQELSNRLGNIELLSEQENNEKRAMPFDEWLISRDDTFLDRHMIPGDKDLHRFENFEHFVQAREQMLVSRLEKLLALEE